MGETIAIVKGVPERNIQLDWKVLMYGIHDTKYFIDSLGALENIQVQ